MKILNDSQKRTEQKNCAVPGAGLHPPTPMPEPAPQLGGNIDSKLQVYF